MNTPSFFQSTSSLPTSLLPVGYKNLPDSEIAFIPAPSSSSSLPFAGTSSPTQGPSCFVVALPRRILSKDSIGMFWYSAPSLSKPSLWVLTGMVLCNCGPARTLSMSWLGLLLDSPYSFFGRSTCSSRTLNLSCHYTSSSTSATKLVPGLPQSGPKFRLQLDLTCASAVLYTSFDKIQRCNMSGLTAKEFIFRQIAGGLMGSLTEPRSGIVACMSSGAHPCYSGSQHTENVVHDRVGLISMVICTTTFPV